MRKTLAIVAFIGTVVALTANPNGQGLKQRTVDLESNYIRVPLSAEDQGYARIDGNRIKQYVEEIVAISRKSRDDGERFWGRIAGERHEALVHQWVEQKFRQFGLEDVRQQAFDLQPQWFPTSWSLTATGGGQTLKIESAFPASRTTATPAGGLDLEAVWLGIGTEADYAGRDIRGKAAVIYSFPTDAPHGQSAAFLGAFQRAKEHGAAAVVVSRATPGNFQMMDSGVSGLPTLYVGGDDLTRMRDLLAKAPLKVHMQLTTEMRPGLKDANTWGTLPGTASEEIFIKAHHDGYFDGAMDNATGVATLVALAEYYSKVPKAQRRRTITFVSVGAHHGGGDRNWMIDPLHSTANAVLMINCEHVSSTAIMTFGDRLRRSTAIDPRRWTVDGSDVLANLTVKAFTKFGVTLYEEMERGNDEDGPVPARAAGPAANRPSMPSSMASINLIHSPQQFYHSENDHPEFVPPPGLEAVTRAFAKIVDEVNKLDRGALYPAKEPMTTASRGQR